ncbi:MAG TPA: DUF4058 domain-containing protein [Gemmataceae bacterium]|nr:DUF4058 domain-containing protein [Gemmataceae bacterium]
MPIHDWTRVDAGLFHDFHQDWTVELSRVLNAGRLPRGYVALIDQEIGGPITGSMVGRQGKESEEEIYSRRANRISIQNHRRDWVAEIDIISPGDKCSGSALHAFVQRAIDLLGQGIHLLLVDLFPPSTRDPQGIHCEIWKEFSEQPFTFPITKPLTVAAYVAKPVTAFVDQAAVGDQLPDMPVFLHEDRYIPVPLEETYQASWAVFPADFKDLLELPPGEFYS